MAAAERLIANQKLAEQKAVAAAEAATAAVAAAAIANPVKEAVNPEVAALTEKMARMEALMSRVEKGGSGSLDMDKFCVYPNAKLPLGSRCRISLSSMGVVTPRRIYTDIMLL